MDTVGRPREVVFHIDCLRRDGELLAQAAARAGLGARVPACPGWQVRDLLRHLGYVHRWAATYVAEQHANWVDRLSEKEILAGGPADSSLLAWFREGHAWLLQTLETADPGVTCWTFLEAPTPLAFWARRQAHETAIHRVDAEQAAPGAARESGFAPGFAVDGIDELIMGFVGRTVKRGAWDGPQGNLCVHTSDGDGRPAHWLLAADAGGFTVSRTAGQADCDVTGPAGELYLALWNRRDLDGLGVQGDASVLAGFREHAQVTWR